eukprot:m.34723 g.34723  ORF g.34723 m.34723 type:complete len:368 (-) comp9945_c0_seq1:54-1157(-)
MTEVRITQTIKYEDLVNGVEEATKIVESSYGPDGMGLLAVVDLPEHFVATREHVHDVIRKFASLSTEEKNTFEVPPFFQRGWDHGHELMKDGTPDKLKGSFYFNPVQDQFEDVDEKLLDQYTTFYGTNLFPTEQVPNFEKSVKKCANFMCEVGALIARECDKVVSTAHGDEEVKPVLENIVREGKHHAARCLYYFPIDKKTVDSIPVDGWCGWHNDHCVLTSLIPAAFYDVEKGESIPNPDPESGLYIKTRDGSVVKPKVTTTNCLLFQIGETAQILSKGKLLATPHMVRAPKVANVARTTMPVFLQPGHSLVLPAPGKDALHVEHLPEGVPELKTRYETDTNFGDFSNRTFAAYYALKGQSKKSQG